MRVGFHGVVGEEWVADLMMLLTVVTTAGTGSRCELHQPAKMMGSLLSVPLKGLSRRPGKPSSEFGMP
jgi:hypothetical protein